MYFYDIGDYYSSGFIGVNSFDQSTIHGDWYTAAYTYYVETRDAFVKSIYSLYSYRTSATPTSVCQRCEQIKTELINSFMTDPRLSAFWDNAEDNNMVNLTKQQYDDYQAVLELQMCLFKDLMKCLDGTDFSSVTYDVLSPVYLDGRSLDFMDDLDFMPSGSDIDLLYYTANTCDYSSLAALSPYDGGVKDAGDGEYVQFRGNLFSQLDDVIEGMYLGFKKSDFPTIDYEFIPTSGYFTDEYYKGNMKRVKHTWWSKASAYTEWNSVSYPTHGVPLSTLLSGVGDFKYLSAISNTSSLPPTATKGDLICVGTPTSYVGYAWDPILNSWTTELYSFINTQILTKRVVQRTNAVNSKRNVMLSLKPMLWANEYLFSDGIRNWQLSNVSGNTVNTIPEILTTNGANLPPKYSITASTHTLSGFTATTIIY